MKQCPLTGSGQPDCACCMYQAAEADRCLYGVTDVREYALGRGHHPATYERDVARAVSRIEGGLVLYEYLEFCNTQRDLPQAKLDPELAIVHISRPEFQELGVTSVETLATLAHAANWELFQGTSGVRDDLSLAGVLLLTDAEFTQLGDSHD